MNIFLYLSRTLLFKRLNQSINGHNHLAHFKRNLQKADLEPVNGAAIDEGGKHPDPVPEVVSDRREGQHHVEVPPDPLNEHVVHVEWGHLHLKVLLQGQLLHLESSKKSVQFIQLLI